MIDDVLVGCAFPEGPQGMNLGRIIAQKAKFPDTVPGATINRFCSSGLQTIALAVQNIQAGWADCVLAGGVESMSQVEFYASPSPRWGIKGDGVSLVDRLGRARTTVGGRSHVIDGGMIETAENLRREYGISRQEQDQLAVQSHQRAVAAQESGVFAEEIVPVSVPQRKGDDLVVDTDEHPRSDTTVEALSGLRAIMGRADSEATVTAVTARRARVMPACIDVASPSAQRSLRTNRTASAASGGTGRSVAPRTT